MMRIFSGLFITSFVLAALFTLTGCQSYTVPGKAADFEVLGVSAEAKAQAAIKDSLTDASVREALSKKPLATFPATLAIARIQAADYTNYSYHDFRQSRGKYTVVTVREMEKDEDLAQLAKMPQIAGIVSMKRILLDQDLYSDLELRTASAKLHANMLLFYTFDTTFHTDTTLPPLTVFSLGLFPNENARVICTASAVLMDVNNGYIYAVVEATSKDNQLANAWTNAEAIEQVRRRTEREAFEKLLAQFKTEWPNVVAMYARRTAN